MLACVLLETHGDDLFDLAAITHLRPAHMKWLLLTVRCEVIRDLTGEAPRLASHPKAREPNFSSNNLPPAAGARAFGRESGQCASRLYFFRSSRNRS
jgi:hypothetical protein